ncbi:MAG: 16S rRNA (adenine(1518)-N(6)/adenine(1519)-N(6))-dimethyltransferase RsmA [Deltaproteobacteria bacterium]|nr:16S rRNA (adenine(1518)-N(6)/adenine(1519)-N(6))-dimethyltransferase RsmA [Deltaproteobacteria bacterium]
MPSLYQEARAVCHELGFRPKKRLGQHFLIDENIIEAILRLVELSERDEILEIGPGIGFLTRRLVAKAKRVWAVEVDPLLVEWLQQSPIGNASSLTLVHADVLKLQLGEILPNRKVKLVANLPYNISTPVLFRILEEREHFSDLVLMVQQEVADRMAASPGTKSYGTLSIWCQVHGEILAKVRVSPSAFFPQPKVRSTILKIGLRSEPLVSAEYFPSLRDVVRACFGQRRKMLSNALGNLLKKERVEIEGLLRNEGIDPRRRGETLSVHEMIRMACTLKSREST